MSDAIAAEAQAGRVAEAASRPATQKGLGILAVLGAVAIWGPSFVATKVILAEVGPYLLAFLRFVLGAALLWPAALCSARGRDWGRLPIGRLAAMGLFGGTLYFALQNVGQVYVTALEASLIGAVLPVVVAVMSWALLKERLRLSQVAGIVLTVAGVVFMVLWTAGARGATFSVLGYLLLLGSAFAWAWFTILGRRVDPATPSTVVAAFNVAFGALFLLPLAAWELRQGGWPQLSALGWLMLLFLGFGGSGLTFVLWNFGLKSLTAGEATTLTNLVPFVGAFSAWAFLGEPLTWVHLWGGLTVLAGLRLVTRE